MVVTALQCICQELKYRIIRSTSIHTYIQFCNFCVGAYNCGVLQNDAWQIED